MVSLIQFVVCFYRFCCSLRAGCKNEQSGLGQVCCINCAAALSQILRRTWDKSSRHAFYGFLFTIYFGYFKVWQTLYRTLVYITPRYFIRNYTGTAPDWFWSLHFVDYFGLI